MTIASDGDIFTAKPMQLSGLLSGIDNHKIALPDFQRPWVWQPEMIYGLLVSVAFRYPAGSLLTMPINGSGFALRTFEGSGDTFKEKPNLMILDGQQRLTSLYQALYSDQGVVVNKKKYHFYLDVNVLLSDEDGSIEVGDPKFEEALFYVSEDKNGKRVRYEALQPKYELTNRDQEIAAGALPLWCVFGNPDYMSQWRHDYIVSILGEDAPVKVYNEYTGSWDKLVQPWVQRIRTYPFPVVELHENMPLGAICHIFEKVNSTGVPLDVFDLCTAILWSQGFKLNRKWDELLTKPVPHTGVPEDEWKPLKEHLKMQPLHGTYFLQGLSLLDSLDRKEDSVGSGVSVNCRKQDLMRLERDRVEFLWDKLVDGYLEAAEFMRNQGVISQRVLPYSTLIVPLASIFAYIRWKKGGMAVKASWNKVAQWYWCSVFSQRYSSQVEYLAAHDFEQVIRWIGGGEEPDVVRTFVFRSDYLQEVRSIRNAIYKGVLCLLARNGAKDFGGAGSLTVELFVGKGQDHHHIFPWNALKNLGISDPRADSIVNKTLIGYDVNRSIGGRLPSQYVKQLSESIGTAAGSEFDAILKSHAISPGMMRDNDWLGFVVDRRERLRSLIEDACGKPTQGFSDVIEDLDMDDVEEEDSESVLG